ncbi:Major facilitator superfamily transporter [Apiospora kogelbergensis]|uniref:Major facilitator superfamily transporter n=1 Tax=Apiospora kogelbergensis TaxID=1337665 RepID=UPI00312F87B5
MGFSDKNKEEAPAEARSVDDSTGPESPTGDGDVVYPDALRTAFVSLGVALGLSLLMRMVVAGWVRHCLAPNSSVLILGRAVMGASAAGLASGGYAILGVTVRPRLRPIFTGFVTTVYSVAKVLGPIIGGYFSQNVTWRWCFYVNLPICGVAALVILLGFKPPLRISETKLGFRQKLSQTDPLSIVLAFCALFCFIRALEIAGIRKPWGSSEVIGLFVGSGLITAAFLGLQFYQGERAVLVPRLLKQRVVHMGMMYGFFHEGAFYLLIYYVPIYFQVVTGASPTVAGVRNLPLLISCGIASAFSGFLVSRFGHYTPLMVLASAGGCVGAGLLSTLTQNSGEAQWIGFQVLAGFFLGAGLPLGTIAGQAKAKDEDLPSTTAMLLFAFCVGSSTSLGAAQSVFTNIVLKKLPFLASNGVSNNMIETGIADIRGAYPPDIVVGVVAAYTDAVRAVFVIATAYAGAAVVFAAGNNWQRLNLK